MTALTRYQRLECHGVWHQSPQAQRRDVVVALGEATLILRDKADAPLTHWSLPAVTRVGSGNMPALFAPGPEDDERLELTDPDMIDALDTIRRAVARSGPRRGRLRLWILGGILAAALALSALWLPGALVSHTARAIPEATRQDIARRLVIAMDPHMGRQCRDLRGRQALDTLRMRLFGAAPWQLQVLEHGRGVVALPGGILVLGGDLLRLQDTPDALAGHLLAGATRAAARDPMLRVLEAAGTAGTFRMLTTGRLSDPTLAAIASDLAAPTGPRDLPVDALLARFEAAGLSSRPYGMTADPGGEPFLPAIEADPHPGGGPMPLMSDAAWLRLQAICEDR